MKTSVITVLAGGWSASQFNLRNLPGTIIAVNDAAMYAPRWDLCVSMDRLWSENRWQLITKCAKPVWLRRSTMHNLDPKAHANVTLFANDHRSTVLSDEAGRLNGTHSGFCALNLAYQMRPRELYLIGFDMRRGPNGEHHWYPDYFWSKNATGAGRLMEWAAQFETAARQLSTAGISVFLVGAAISVKSFRRLNRLPCAA